MDRMLRLAVVVSAGICVILGEAAGRFGWLGMASGLPFPPEVLSQAVFTILPARLLSLGIALLGASAKWVVFGVTTVLWAAAMGIILQAAVQVSRHILPSGWVVAALVTGALVEGAWWKAASGTWMAKDIRWPATLVTLVAYLAGAAIVTRGKHRVEGKITAGSGGAGRP